MPKYADHPSVTVSVDVDATPAELWPIISDPTVPVRFSQELAAVEWVEPFDHAEVGALFDGTNRHPAVGEWTVRCHVSVCEPEREFGWDPGGPDNVFTKWRLRTDPIDGARTRLIFTAQMGFGPSGLTPAIEAMPDREDEIVERRLGEWRDNMTRTVEGIKALAEGREG